MITQADLLPGDILLYHGHSWLAKAIRLFDGTRVNHAGIYLGDGAVGEALGKGVIKTELAGSIKGDQVWVYRHKDRPSNMLPVITVAQDILAVGNRYGFEQILLLAMLGITRRLAVPGAAGVFLRGILDKAASILVAYKAQERQPMICSEFVYRCYDQALPQAVDVYSIEITGRSYELEGLLPGAGVHPKSVLSLFSPASPLNSFLPRVPEGVDKPIPAISMEDIQKEAEAYFAEVESAKGRGNRKEENMEELRASVFRFASVLHATRHTSALPSELGMRALGASSPKFTALLGVEADFVTPGDLLKSPSLYEVGQIS